MPGPSDANAADPLTEYHLLLVQRGPRGELNRSTVETVRAALNKHVSTEPDRTRLTVWLDTPGGDPHATYKLYLELKSRCTSLHIVVVDYAKSAGTLLALGADKLFMTASAELGPLDAQIGHPDREELIVSALNVAGSLEHLSKLAIQIAVVGGAQVLEYTQLPRAIVLKHMLTFASDFLRPAVEKLDPHMVHRANEQLQIAKRYASTMLDGRKDVSTPLTGADSEVLLQKLVSEYPEHGYVISRDEAKELGLPVYNAEEHPAWAVARVVLPRMLKAEKVFATVIGDTDFRGLLQDKEQEETPDETQAAEPDQHTQEDE